MECIIVDDEPQARKLLQTYISSIGGFTVARLCTNAMEAFEALSTGNVDIMFLDIKMPLLSGVDFLRSLKTPPLVIFTTAYAQYAIEGYELDVLDYLVKPISMARLVNALDKARLRMQQKTALKQPSADFIFIKQEGRQVKILLDKIEYIEGMQNYVKIMLLDKNSIVSASTMKAMEELLHVGQFIRVHRSFIVPLAAITAFTSNVIETASRKIPIGISYRDDVLKLIGKH